MTFENDMPWSPNSGSTAQFLNFFKPLEDLVYYDIFSKWYADLDHFEPVTVPESSWEEWVNGRSKTKTF